MTEPARLIPDHWIRTFLESAAAGDSIPDIMLTIEDQFPVVTDQQ